MGDLGITSGTPAHEIYQKLLEGYQSIPGFSLSDVLEEGGGLRILFEYMQDIGHPMLLPPKEGGDEGPPQTLEKPPSFEQALMDSLNQALYKLLEENPDLKEIDLDQLLNHVLLGTPLDPKLQSIMDQLDESIIENMAEGWELTDDQQKKIRDGKYRDLLPTFAASYQKDVEKDINSAFDNETKKLLEEYASYLKEQGYSDEEIAEMKKDLETKLYLVRSGFSDFTDEELSTHGFQGKNVLDLWGDIKQSALNTVSSLWSLESGKVDSLFSSLEYTSFIAKATFEKDNHVENLIRQYGEDNGLTEKEIKMMIYLYYNRDTAFLGEGDVENFPGISEERFNELLGVVNGFEAQSLSKLGFPDNLKLDPGKELFNARINAEFQRIFYQNLKNQEPPLTDQQIKDIIAALRDPEWATNAPQDLVAIINKVIEQTSTQITNEFGVPATWGPSLEALQSLGSIGKTTLMAWGVVDQLEDFLNILKSMLDAMPGGPDNPDKMSLLNVYALISKFLNKLKEMIAFMQIKDTDLSAVLSAISLDLFELKEAESRKIKDEMELKQAEANDWGLWVRNKMDKWPNCPDWVKEMCVWLAEKSKAFCDWMPEWLKVTLQIVAIVMATCMFGPYAGAMLLTIFIAGRMEAAGKDVPKWMDFANIIDKVGDGCCDAINCIPGVEMSDKAYQITSMVFQVIFIAGVCGAASANPMFMAEMFFSQSGVIQEICIMSDPEWMTPMYAELINMACHIAVMAPYMIGEAIFTGGASAGAEIAKMMAKVCELVAKILTKIAVWIAKIMEKLGASATKIQSFLIKMMGWQRKLMDASRKFAKFGKVASKVVDEEKFGPFTSFSKLAKSDKFKAFLETDDFYIGIFKHLQKPLKYFYEADYALKTVETAVTVEQNVIQATIHNIKAQLALLEGELGELDEEIKALVAIIKKLIEKLLDIISGMGEWMQNVGTQQSALWSERSQILSQVFGQA